MDLIFENPKVSGGEPDLAGKIKYPKGFEKYLREILPAKAIFRRGERKAFFTCCEKFSEIDPAGVGARRTVPCPFCGRKTEGVIFTGRFREYAGVLISWASESGKHLYMAYISVFLKYNGEWESLCLTGKLRASVIPEAFFSASGKKQEAFTRVYCGWRKDRDKVYSLYRGSGCTVAIHEDSFREAVPRSFLRYSGILGFRYTDPQSFVKYVFLNARYPQVEYLEKAGLVELVDDRLYGRRTYRALNWRKKTLSGMLGLSGQHLRAALTAIPENHPGAAAMIAIYKRCISEGWRISPEDLKSVCQDIDLVDDAGILKGSSVRKVCGYLSRQIEKEKAESPDRAVSFRALKIDYRDYLGEIEALGYPVGDPYYRFPRDLQAAHRATARELADKEADILEAQCARWAMEYCEEHLPALERFCWRKNGLLIRPARGYGEIRAEGTLLHHCVANYWESVASGRTAIFFIRKEEIPDESFYTLELDPAWLDIRQCRGRWTCDMTKEVSLFVAEWQRYIRTKARRKSA